MRRFSVLIIILLGLMVFFGIVAYQEWSAKQAVVNKNGAPITVTFLDIGQGDATFFAWPDGTQMLVDCAKDSRILPALGRVMPFYDRSIDYLVVTHPDLDHYGGCIDVLKRFEVKHIVYNGYDKEYDPMVVEFKATIINESSEYFEPISDTSWSIASSTLQFLYPDHQVALDPGIPGNTKDTGANNASIVFELTYGESEILMTGDAEAPLEEYLMRTYARVLDSDVLKVGHHGSAGSSIQAFVDIVSPQVAVISAGRDNSYGHPHLRTLRRLERAEACILRTDRLGDIQILVYPDHIEHTKPCA